MGFLEQTIRVANGRVFVNEDGLQYNETTAITAAISPQYPALPDGIRRFEKTASGRIFWIRVLPNGGLSQETPTQAYLDQMGVFGDTLLQNILDNQAVLVAPFVSDLSKTALNTATIGKAYPVQITSNVPLPVSITLQLEVATDLSWELPVELVESPQTILLNFQQPLSVIVKLNAETLGVINVRTP